MGAYTLPTSTDKYRNIHIWKLTIICKVLIMPQSNYKPTDIAIFIAIELYITECKQSIL